MKNNTQKSTLKRKDWKRTTTLMALPGTLFYSFFFVIPVCMGVYYSFTDWNGVKRTNNFVLFDNYIKALTSKRFLNSVLFNLKYTLIYTICIIVLATLIAMLLNNQPANKKSRLN